MDPPFGGGLHMVQEWRNGDASVCSRLDRFRVSTDLAEYFPDMIQKGLPRPFTDHFPICLGKTVLERGKNPFRFENMRLKFEGFY